MKIFIVVFFCSVSLAFGQSKAQNTKWLVFEGEVIKIGKSPGIVCGVTAPYRLAKYKVKKVYQGIYKENEIVVHHLFCQVSVLQDLTEGDHVLVMIDLNSPPAQRLLMGKLLSSAIIYNDSTQRNV